MWVPLVENNEFDGDGADYFVRLHLDRLLAADPLVDTVVLGCTHYPLLERKISLYLSPGIAVISQGATVAQSLADYLLRHTEIAERCTARGRRDFYSSETAEVFERSAMLFYGRPVHCRQKS